MQQLMARRWFGHFEKCDSEFFLYSEEIQLLSLLKAIQLVFFDICL